jgi:hypothetical protein
MGGAGTGHGDEAATARGVRGRGTAKGRRGDEPRRTGGAGKGHGAASVRASVRWRCGDGARRGVRRPCARRAAARRTEKRASERNERARETSESEREGAGTREI